MAIQHLKNVFYYTFTCCIYLSQGGEEKKDKEDEVQGSNQEPSDLTQPTDIEIIKPAEVPQDKDESIQPHPFESIGVKSRTTI